MAKFRPKEGRLRGSGTYKGESKIPKFSTHVICTSPPGQGTGEGYPKSVLFVADVSFVQEPSTNDHVEMILAWGGNEPKKTPHLVP